MNELQQQEYELLKIFVELCGRYDLRYFLVCGSALGAVKYKGFIPWDDDIDVGMPRADYEVFLSKAQEELPENLFLQNYRTDKYFPHVYTKLRNSDTTLIESNMSHLKINHGIYIDIFPLDGVPESSKEVKKLKLKKKVLSWFHYCALNNKGNWKVTFRNCILRFFRFHKRTQNALYRLDKVISKYDTENSEIWCNHGNWQGDLEYAPKWQYGCGVEAEFEDLKVTVPEHYDDYLTQKYGNWRADPPTDKQRSHHSILTFDVNNSYKEYLNF